MGFQPITGPLAVPANDGLRAARGLGVVENPSDPLDADGRWRSGWRFRRVACGGGYRRDPCDYTTQYDYTAGSPTNVAPRPGWRQGMPFLIGAARECSTWGWSASDYAAEARNLLNVVQYAQIGAELWRGEQAKESGWDNPYLAQDEIDGNPNPDFVDLMSANSLNPATDAFSPTVGLAAIEDALAVCSPGGLKLIHAPRAIVTVWGMGGTLRFEGGRLFTPAGSQIIAESSYDGSGPDSIGNPAASLDGMWVYGTGPVQIRVDNDIQTYPAADDIGAALNRLTNDLAFRAEKLAMVAWDCCHVGVRIQVSG